MAVHRYWRLTVTGSALSSGGASVAGGSAHVASLEMRNSSGGANLSVTGNGVASADGSDGGGFEAGKAFDSNASTAWLRSGTEQHWVQWDFGAGNEQEINHFTLVSHSGYGGNIGDGVFSYSDNGSVWTTLLAFTGRSTAASASSTHTYTPPAVGSADLACPRPTLIGFCGARSALVSPGPTVITSSGANAKLTGPAPALKAFAGVNAALSSPRATFYAAGRSSAGDNDFTYTSPPPSLSANGGANGKLTAPAQTLVVTATVTGWGRASLAAPAATLFAAGTVSGTASTALSVPTASLIGYSGAVCSVTLTGGATMQASGTAGGIGRAVMSCPLFELTASASAQDYGSADLLAPAPRIGATAQAWLAAPGAKLTAIGTAVVAVEYEAYAVNLRSELEGGGNEVTRYTNFPFERIVRYQGSYYGMAADGLYLLEGSTDGGAPIEWVLRTGTTDFNKPEKKNTASAYVGGRLGPATTFTVFTGEKSENQYAYTTPRGATAQNYRQKFGRGLDARYYAFQMEGDGELEMDDLTIEVAPRTRRI